VNVRRMLSDRSCLEEMQDELFGGEYS
jgi:hypothetical protein